MSRNTDRNTINRINIYPKSKFPSLVNHLSCNIESSFEYFYLELSQGLNILKNIRRYRLQ